MSIELENALDDLQFIGAYDDMLGEVRSAISGGTSWNTAAINDTGFLLGWLRNNSSDYFQLKIQAPHRRERDSVLADIHVHYCLQTAPSASQTVIFDVYYTWIVPGNAVPAIGSWTHNATVTQILTGTEPAWYYGLFNFATDIAAPANEGYGSMLLVKITRGNGTYTGEYGILDADAHSIMDKMGSLYAISDTTTTTTTAPTTTTTTTSI